MYGFTVYMFGWDSKGNTFCSVAIADDSLGCIEFWITFFRAYIFWSINSVLPEYLYMMLT
jgi:hypothetical protein